LGEEIKLMPERIVDIVLQALKPVTEHRKIKIYANKEDLEILEKEKPKIKELLKEVESLSILERGDVEKGGCIIETEAGIINAQLENQWKALETAFKSFMEKSK
jgi:type III secretion protein L